MIGTFTDLKGTRVLVHENNGIEIRFINDKTGDVSYKKLNNDEVDMIIRMLTRLREN